MSNFRAVIIGAGPAGLFTAHALNAAGIDFVVLERQPEVVRYRGALLLLWPPIIRLLDQLGLYEATLAFSTRVTTKTNLTHNGEPLCSDHVFAALEDELGYPHLGLSRGNLLRVLHENLPGRETKIKTNARVVRTETREDGVRVHLADGSFVDGSIVIAADGVHSQSRELIRRLAESDTPNGPDTLNGKKNGSPMRSVFISLIGHTRGVRDDIPLGDFIESHGPGIASQCMKLNESMYFTVLKRLDTPITEEKRLTPEEANSFAEELSDLTIFPGIKLKEIWPMREQSNVVLLHQEEGLADKWHHGRIVIVGDAAHKMTSVNGQGAMSGALSAAALVNQLRATLHRAKNPSVEDLEAAFDRYETSRKPVTGGLVNLGIGLTRFITWTSEGDEALDREVSHKTNMVEEAKKRMLSVFQHSPILDFVPFEGKHGTTPWAFDSQPAIRPRL